jgi:hypothetical protein
VTKLVKLDIAQERGAIWVEAVEIPDEKPAGRESVGLGKDAIATLATAFEEFYQIFQVAHGKLSQLAHDARETSVEIAAKISTKGNLIIVQGSAEASIKVTMKWSAPKGGHGKMSAA